MMNLFLFLSFIFLFTFAVGKVLERVRIPWIVAPLLLGTLLAIYNPFSAITSSAELSFLAQLGMYFLLFIVGLQINIHELKVRSWFILKTTFSIIIFEAIFGGMLIHFLFGYTWLISFLVSLSFAAVGQTILIPILDEFKLLNSRLGQTIIAVGALNNIIEIIIVMLAIALITSNNHLLVDVSFVFISLFLLFALTMILTKLKDKEREFRFLNIQTSFVFVIFILFFFLGIGAYGESSPLAALLAGVGVKSFIPEDRFSLIEPYFKTLVYGFFAPIFFVWVASGIDIMYIATSPFLVILVYLVSKIAKILGGFLATRKELGVKKSILVGIGLSVRFSTSIIIINLLYQNDIIKADLYSVILASIILFKFITPALFSWLLLRWKIPGVLVRWKER